MKFQASDRRYLAERRALSESYGPRELWSIVDQWPLYVGSGNLARFMAISDLFRSTLEVPGHLAEFGTWRGANSLFLAKLLHIYDPHSQKVLHAFDSFEGLTAFAPEDAHAVEAKGEYRGSLQELRDMLRLYDLEDEVLLHQGLIEETLPEFLEDNQQACFSLIYCDTDLYTSTRLILERMHPRLMKGGVFILDEWNYESFPGEGVAVREFLDSFGGAYKVEAVRHARQPSLVLRKIEA